MLVTRRVLGQSLCALAGVATFGLAMLYLTTHRTRYASLGFTGHAADTYGEAEASKYYEWHTVSEFVPADCTTAEDRSIACLCSTFPKHRLNNIQPVLKTGHSVVDTRVRYTLNSTAACLDNLLIFSELNEDFGGRKIIDVLADIPQRYTQTTGALKPWRRLHELAETGTFDPAATSVDEVWHTDRFKFLASISRAWRMRPGRRWYVFFEGDTFIVWDTVFRLLENFDPDVPHYFGSPSPRDDIWFANGGPGYILSRAAMQRLVKDDWHPKTGEYLGSQLSVKHWDEVVGNCCGDSSLGWALWTEEVPLEGLWPMFNPHPLHNVPFSDLYWCAPVLSLHKSNAMIAADFWRWQFEDRPTHRPILYRDVALSFFNLTRANIRHDHGNADWAAFRAPDDGLVAAHMSVQACSDACHGHPECFQWTYHLRECTFVRSFSYGQARTPSTEKDPQYSEQDKRYIAGWDTVKITEWAEVRPCEQVEWVRPSTERIF